MTPTTKALAALTGAYTLSQFFRSYIAVIAPELSRDLGLGPSGFGWLSSVFFLSFAVAQIPVGIAFDRYGVGRPSMILMILGIFSALLFAAAPHPTFSMIAQSGLGFACAPLYMGLIYYAARHLHDHRYVQVISMVGAVGSVGALLAATPLGWATEVIGWRISVGLSAVLALIAALSLYRWVDDRPVTPPPRQPLGATLWSCVTLFRQPGIWPLVPVCFTMAAGSAFRNAWGGPYLAAVYGLDPVARGQAMSVVSVLGLIAAFSLAPLVRRWRPKQVAVSWLIAGVVGGTFHAIVPAANLGLSIFIIALLFSVANIHPLVMSQGKELISPEIRGRGLGVLNTFVFLGSALISASFGWIIRAAQDYGLSDAAGYGWLFFTSAFLLFLGLVPYLRSRT